MTYSWRFDRMRASSKNREPIQGEFFATDAISNPGEALVREGIQNSLDARRNGEKVMVRIRVSGTVDAVARDVVAPFLNGLDEHLKAPGNGLRTNPNDNENCFLLVFEDFGTTGLLGNVADWKPAFGSRNHFYHFFRAEGRSDKSGKDIGRWGVGKQVFPRASGINSIFGLTVRNDDRKKLLMGMAVLKSHDVNGTRYAPDGWLGRPSEKGDEGLVMPIEDKEFIDSFSNAFDLQRGDDPGLTVVVPWCDLELTDENLVHAVLCGYFWPILRGQLEVIVEARNIETLLDGNSLKSEIRKIGGDLEKDILPLVRLASWANGLPQSSFTNLKVSQGWKWSKDMFPDDSLTGIRKRYERAEKIAIRVPLVVTEKGQQTKNTSLDVFLYRDGSEQSGRPVFIREGIIIPDVRRRGSSALRGVRSLVIAEDGPIAAFLGDAENPAHTQWQKDGDNFKGKYEDGPKILDFITRSAIEIVRIVNEQDKKEDRTLLADLFSIPALPEELETRTREKKKLDKPGTEPKKPTFPEPRPKHFIIDQITEGFVVRSGDINGSPPPEALLIRAAYQIRRGNALKKYHPADFDFSQRMKTHLKGATAIEKKENRLRVRIDNNDFRIEVTGFDRKRDVRVEVRRQEGDNASSDA